MVYTCTGSNVGTSCNKQTTGVCTRGELNHNYSETLTTLAHAHTVITIARRHGANIDKDRYRFNNYTFKHSERLTKYYIIYCYRILTRFSPSK